MSRASEVVKNYLRVPFIIIVWMMETYSKNRQRLRTFMAQPGTKTAFKWAITVTALAWIVIAFMARDEHGQRLNDALIGVWGDTQTLIEEREAKQKSTVQTQ
ncbi:hypothetical protein [Magnetovibrio blakemorei]|uniref:Uncharacterized protein n=1 Tax=Magnetovibrio blakemorei TaxID=28181 RepID=A0A1E5Q7D7_9PROT|nr:hypothetical protein [Magnetovibrio blakemorei]OEJ67008.1 hypothetical protein BEN30_10610 [Magnetovibrio blakemorei]